MYPNVASVPVLNIPPQDFRSLHSDRLGGLALLISFRTATEELGDDRPRIIAASQGGRNGTEDILYSICVYQRYIMIWEGDP